MVNFFSVSPILPMPILLQQESKAREK
jgi:hypothetical protein